VIKEHIRTFIELYLENNYNVTDAKVQSYICKSMSFGLDNIDIKDVRLILAELCKEGKLTEVLILNDLVIYDKVIK
jgi:hypothetical protein